MGNVSRYAPWYDVYALIDPFEMQAFYVGITDNLLERYIAHVKMRDDNAAKNARIEAIINRGCLPLINVLITVQGKEGALDFEALWIETFRLWRQPLTNRELRVYENTPSRQAVLNSAIEQVNCVSTACNMTIGLMDASKLVDLIKNDAGLQEAIKKYGYTVTYKGRALDG